MLSNNWLFLLFYRGKDKYFLQKIQISESNKSKSTAPRGKFPRIFCASFVFLRYLCGAESHDAMKTVHIPEVASTNTLLLDLLQQNDPTLEDGLTLYTLRQTAGRGQPGNKWEAEPDRNISFSLLLYPGAYLEVRHQFLLSMVASLAVVRTLRACGVPDVTIKWPNDIFAGDRKICGMLIENRIFTARNWQSVIGIGINVNQRQWVGNAPNPTSILLQTDSEYEPTDVMTRCLTEMEPLLARLRRGDEASIIQAYNANLYRRDGLFPYVDVASGQPFDAAIGEIGANGALALITREGERREYMFKEVMFVLPGRVTKE